MVMESGACDSGRVLAKLNLTIWSFIANDCMNANPTQDTTLSFKESETKERGRDGDGDVDAVLNAAENSDQDSS